MNPEDLLYYYANYYLRHNVHITLLYENWFDKTLDVRDARYLQEYIFFRNLINVCDLSALEAEELFKSQRKERIEEMYTTLFNDMIGHLDREKKIHDNEKKALEAKLNVYRSLDYVNFLYVDKLREFEEERY